MSTATSTTPLRAESAVKQRYAAAARAPEAALCCPVEYNADYLKVIPPEVIEKDFFAFVEPLKEIALAEAKSFACGAVRIRHPKETKGQEYNITTDASRCCDGGNGTCC